MADLRANGADRDLHSSDLGGHAPDAVRHEAPLLQQQHGAGGADDAAAALAASASKAVPIFLTIGAAMGAFAFGLHIGYSSPNEDAIQATVGLTQSQADLMFSLLNAGAMVGCLSAGSIATLFGPKRALLFNSLPYVAASVVFSFWDTYAGLCIGRVLAGVAVGFASVLVPLYVAEISPAALRGALGCVNQLMICSGITAANILGLPTVNDLHWWKMQMMLYLIPIGVQVLVLFVYAPESPTWLVRAGQTEAARAALRRLRGSAYNVDAEVDLIRGALQSSPKPSAPANTKGDRSDRSTAVRIDDVIAADHDRTQAAAAGLVAGPAASAGAGAQSSIWQQLMAKKALRPLVVGLGLVLIQQWSGINAVMFNSAQLFATKGATAITTEAIEGAIAVNSVQIAFTLLAVLTMSRRGRRFFLLLSTLGMAASSVALGGVFYADAASGWKIALVCVYLAFFAMGVGPVVWLVASEIFPSAVRATALGIVVVVNWGSSFAVTASFNPMNDALGNYGVFWFYGAILLAGAAFVYVKLPETKDKTLEQIEHTFASD